VIQIDSLCAFGANNRARHSDGEHEQAREEQERTALHVPIVADANAKGKKQS
jgi:hypothetical protein